MFPLLAVIIEPFMSVTTYGFGSNGGVCLLVLFCLTMTVSPMLMLEGLLFLLSA